MLDMIGYLKNFMTHDVLWFDINYKYENSHNDNVNREIANTVELGYNVIEGTKKIMTLCPSDVIKSRYKRPFLITSKEGEIKKKIFALLTLFVIFILKFTNCISFITISMKNILKDQKESTHNLHLGLLSKVIRNFLLNSPF